MRRIRVIQLVSGVAIGDQSGGAELFGIQMARHLPRDEFEPAIFAMWRYDSPSERDWLAKLEAEGIPVFGLVRTGGTLLRDLAHAFPSFWSTVSHFQPDIVSSHTERGDVFNAFVRAFHPAHPGAVRTKHTDHRWQNWPLVGVVIEQVLYPYCFYAEVAVAQSVRDVLDKRLLARLRRKRSILCYNGIDLSEFDYETQKTNPKPLPAGVPCGRPSLAVIGRLSTQKGHAYLLHAMQIVRRVQPAHLLVIGSGPLEDELRRLAKRLGIEDGVHFLGSRSDVLAILPCLDLVVSSSLWEGLPTVLLEAMALGVPVVATDVSGSRELVRPGETGTLVPPGQPSQLADAILKILADPVGAHTMAVAARRVASQYSIQNAAAQHARLYRQIALGQGNNCSGV